MITKYFDATTRPVLRCISAAGHPGPRTGRGRPGTAARGFHVAIIMDGNGRWARAAPASAASRTCGRG